jgi:hypothetical protein
VTPEQAVAAARWTLKRDVSCPPLVVGALLTELDSRGVAIERVRELHQPREEILYYQNNEPVHGTTCSTCVYTGDDEDPAGNRFRVVEHETWPCDTIEALGGAS